MKKLPCLLTTALISFFLLTNPARAEDGLGYDLSGKWVFRGLDVQCSFCDGSSWGENVEFDISISQTGDEIRMVFGGDVFEGRTSGYFLGAEIIGQTATTVITGRVSEDADKVTGSIVFYDKNECPNAETGSAEYVLYRASSTEERPFRYYVPLYSSTSGFATGIALSNVNEFETANVAVQSFDSEGNRAGELKFRIPADGQRAEVLKYSRAFKGWTLVESDQPLAGLCFLASAGSGADNYMADVPISSTKSEDLQIPHAACDDNWDTTVYIANPNSVSQHVSVKVLDLDGGLMAETAGTMEPNGSWECRLSEILNGGRLTRGKVKISAKSGIAAFALYDNIKTGARSFAGISAVDPNSLRVPGR